MVHRDRGGPPRDLLTDNARARVLINISDRAFHRDFPCRDKCVPRCSAVDRGDESSFHAGLKHGDRWREAEIALDVVYVPALRPQRICADCKRHV